MGRHFPTRCHSVRDSYCNTMYIALLTPTLTSRGLRLHATHLGWKVSLTEVSLPSLKGASRPRKGYKTYLCALVAIRLNQELS